MKYFDSHTHVNFAAYNDDREAVILRAKDAGVAMNVVGTQLDTSTSAVAIEKLTTFIPEGRAFNSGSRVRFPKRITLFMYMLVFLTSGAS